MSKNFELLQRAERMSAVLPIPVHSVSRANGDPVRMDLDAVAREEAVKLVHRVFYAQESAGIHTIVFSGIGNSKACARVCSATGAALAAQTGGTVCVVDTDFRSPHVHEFFRTANLGGFSDALSNSENVKSLAIQTAHPNLWIIPCGARTVDIAAHLTSEQMIQRFAKLRGEFNYVLISAPPADAFTEAATLGRMADGVILVVDADHSLREAARKAKKSLEDADVRLLGAVLNNRTFPIPERLYNRLR